MSKVADKFEVMADAVMYNQDAHLKTLVRDEVQRALAPTVSILNDIKAMLNK